MKIEMPINTLLEGVASFSLLIEKHPELIEKHPTLVKNIQNMCTSLEEQGEEYLEGLQKTINELKEVE